MDLYDYSLTGNTLSWSLDILDIQAISRSSCGPGVHEVMIPSSLLQFTRPDGNEAADFQWSRNVAISSMLVIAVSKCVVST